MTMLVYIDKPIKGGYLTDIEPHVLCDNSYAHAQFLRSV